jgi:hypothetical protein
MPPRKRTDTTTIPEEMVTVEEMTPAETVEAEARWAAQVADRTNPPTEPAVGPATGSGVTVSGVPDAATPDWAAPMNALNVRLADLTRQVTKLDDQVRNTDEWINPTDGPNLIDDLNAVGQRVRDNENLLATFIESVGQRFETMSRELSTRGAINDAPPAIFAAILGIMNDVTGVGKHGQMDPAARMGNYKYQRYDDLKRELGAAFRTHAVFLQSDTTRLVTERVGEGGRMTRVVVSATYRFTSLVDGSELTFDSHGESMDKSDKATGKAMTMALKSALIQAFMLAAEDTEDPDATRPGEYEGVVKSDDQPRREPHPTNADVAAAQRVEREYAVGEQVTVAGQTFVKHSDGPALGASGGPSYTNQTVGTDNGPPKDQADPWDQGPPKDTRTPGEAAQAAVVKLSNPSLTLDEWSAISAYAQTMGLLDVEITAPDGAKMALKHYLIAVSRTLT